MNERIGRFLDDQAMSAAVYDVLLKCFLKEADGDVHTLAAQRIAITLLQGAWAELERYRPLNKREDASQANPGM